MLSNFKILVVLVGIIPIAGCVNQTPSGKNITDFSIPTLVRPTDIGVNQAPSVKNIPAGQGTIPNKTNLCDKINDEKVRIACRGYVLFDSDVCNIFSGELKTSCTKAISDLIVKGMDYKSSIDILVHGTENNTWVSTVCDGLPAEGCYGWQKRFGDLACDTIQNIVNNSINDANYYRTTLPFVGGLLNPNCNITGSYFTGSYYNYGKIVRSAYESKDISICETLSSYEIMKVKESCYWTIALYTKNIDACERMSDSSVLSVEPQKSRCYSVVAKDNPELCEKAVGFGGTGRDLCYLNSVLYHGRS